MDTKKLYSGDERTFLEIQLRGLYLKLAAELEFILSEIITICLVKKVEDRKQFKIIMLETPTLGKKLSIAKSALAHYSTHYFSLCEKQLNELDSFTNKRNLFAHSLIIPIAEQDGYFTFEYIKKGQIRKEVKGGADLLIDLNNYSEMVLHLVKLLGSLWKEEGKADYT